MAHRARIRSLYFLIAMNILLLVAAAVLLAGMLHLQHRLNKAEDRNFAGCERGNELREGYRFAMTKLGSPGRAAKPEVQEQPCALIYPGGAK